MEAMMSKNLWELRKQRNLTVKQLAAKSGVPAKNIYAYEAGEQVKIADMDKLAKALFVNKIDIKFQSDPIPKNKPEPPPKPAPAPKPQSAAPAAVPEERPSRPATEGQLNHLRALVNKLGLDHTAVAQRINQPLDELTFQAARSWLKTFEGELKLAAGQRPPDTRRWRAFLPEGVDEFEANYLLARQQAGDEVTFTLLDDTTFNGRIVGFGPYSITIRQADGTETTIQKLALATYQVAAEEENP